MGIVWQVGELSSESCCVLTWLPGLGQVIYFPMAHLSFSVQGVGFLRGGGSLVSSSSRPHFCQYQTFSHTLAWSRMCVLCVYMCPGALGTAEALLCGGTRCPPCSVPSLHPGLCEDTRGLACSGLVAQGRPRDWGWFRHEPLLPVVVSFQPFLPSYMPTLSFLSAKRISSISKEVPKAVLVFS